MLTKLIIVGLAVTTLTFAQGKGSKGGGSGGGGGGMMQQSVNRMDQLTRTRRSRSNPSWTMPRRKRRR